MNERRLIPSMGLPTRQKNSTAKPVITRPGLPTRMPPSPWAGIPGRLKRSRKTATYCDILPTTAREGLLSVRKRKWTTRSGEVKEAWIVDYAKDGKRHIGTFKKKKEADAYAQQLSSR